MDIALPAEDVFHNLVFESIKRTYPMQARRSSTRWPDWQRLVRGLSKVGSERAATEKAVQLLEMVLAAGLAPALDEV